MERAEPIEEYAEIGFSGAIILAQAERYSISNGKTATISETLSFARSIGAIIDEGAGEMLLIQTKKGDQYLLAVIGLEGTIDDLP